MAAFVRGFNVLQQELEKTKESLKDVDENIKKLTGRDPTELGRSGQQRRILLGFNERGGVDSIVNRGGRKRVPTLGKWALAETDQGPPRKKRTGSIASRLGPRPSRSSQDSGDADELIRKPSVPSSVVATSRDSLTRKDMLDAQCKDERGMARNKRMFGLLLGTLQKFKDEAKDKKDKHDQRKQVELKLEEKAQQEKDEIRKERELLFQNRREKQARIRLLEQKMELVATHEKCEVEIRKLTNFICTKTKPCVFYLPKVHTPATESLLSDTTKVVDDMVAERRRRLTAEISELMGPSPLASTIVAGDEQGMEMEEDNSENIPSGPTVRRDGDGPETMDSDKRYPHHYRGGTSGGKDWSKNNKDKRTSKRSSSSGAGAGGGDQHHHHHQDNKTGSKHEWDERQPEIHRVSKSSKVQQQQQHSSTAITSSSAVSSKSVSNKWQLLMEMDSGLEEDEDRVVVVPTPVVPVLSIPTAAIPTPSSTLTCQRDEEEEDDEEEPMVEISDKREVRLEESSMNGTEDRRLVDASGVVTSRRVVLAADVEDDDDDDNDDEEEDDDDDDDNEVSMNPTSNK